MADLRDYWQNVRGCFFEIVNRCPMAGKSDPDPNGYALHVKCPATEFLSLLPQALPMEKVFEVCKNLQDAENGKAVLYFHVYNEPTIDSRLGYMIYHIRRVMGMPNTITINSCCWGLDKNVMKDLIELGVTSFKLTMDNEPMYEHWQGIREELGGAGVAIRCHRAKKDNRLKIYEGEHLYPSELDGEWKPLLKEFRCTAPLSYLIIGATGDVLLCEFDWKRTHVFGNIYKDSWEDIVANKRKVYEISHNQGSREGTEICKKCTTQYRHW